MARLSLASEHMTARTAPCALAALLLAAPAAGSESERALYRIYQARAAQDVAEAEAQGPRFATPSAPVPMEIRTGASNVAIAAPRAAAAGAASGGAPAERSLGCMLPRDGSHAATTGQCLGCHGQSMGEHSGHPVEVDYEDARVRSGSQRGHLRPIEEAVRRGAFVPDGKVRCVSCHDGHSRWRYRLAIPPDADLRPAVRASDARTYDPAPATRAAAASPLAARAQAAALPDGTEVSARPLCLSCHPMD